MSIPVLSQLSDDLIFFSFIFLDRLSATSSHSLKVGEKKKENIVSFFSFNRKALLFSGRILCGLEFGIKNKNGVYFFFFLSKASGRV